eukprot:193133_1
MTTLEENDFGYDAARSLPCDLDDKHPEFSQNQMSSLLYQFESGAQVLSVQQIEYLASGFIRMFCDNDPKNSDASSSIPLHKIIQYSQFGSSNYLSLRNYNPLNIQQRRYCYHCYASSINDEHASFLVCSRCKTAKYCNQNCQKANWKYHKPSCLSIKKQKEIRDHVDTLSARKCIKHLQAQHKTGKFTFDTICYFQRIQHLLETRRCKDAGDVGYDLHVMPPKYSRWCTIPSEYYKVFYSCPGIPEFIFNSSLTRVSRVRFYKKFGFPPNWDKFDGRDYELDYDSDEEIDLSDDTFSFCEFNGLDAYQMAFYIVNMLINTMHNVSGQQEKNVQFISLCVRRLFEWYSNPDVIDDCGDALGPLGQTIKSLMPLLHSNEFVDSPNFGSLFEWENFIFQTSFLDCVVKELLEFQKRYALNILMFVVDHITHQDIWRDKRDGSYFLALFSWMLLNLSSYDYDDTEMELEANMCRRAINIALNCHDGVIETSQIRKYVQYVVGFQCKRTERNEAELNAKLEMFRLRPCFGFSFSPYSDRPFWYFFYYYYLQKDEEIVLKDNESDESECNECIVERAHAEWNAVPKGSEVYKVCYKASMNKAMYVDWMRMRSRF